MIPLTASGELILQAIGLVRGGKNRILLTGCAAARCAVRNRRLLGNDGRQVEGGAKLAQSGRHRQSKNGLDSLLHGVIRLMITSHHDTNGKGKNRHRLSRRRKRVRQREAHSDTTDCGGLGFTAARKSTCTNVIMLESCVLLDLIYAFLLTGKR